MLTRDGAEIRYDLGWRTGLWIGLTAVAVIVLFGVIRTVASPLTWLVLGFLLATAVEPVVTTVERLVRRRWAAVALVAGFGLTLGGLVLVFMFPLAAREAGRFATDAPRLVERLGDLPVIGKRLADAGAPAKIEEWVRGLPQRLSTNGEPVERLFRSTLNGTMFAVATAVVFVAAMLDGERVRRGVTRLAPPSRRHSAERAIDIVDRTVGRYFAGSVLIAVLAGSGVLAVGLAAGVPLAPVAAVWVSMTNLVPQVGGLLGGSLFVMLGATQGPTTLVICLAWFLVYQQFENNVLQPTIVGDAVDLSPPTTMLAALVGAAAFGVPGAVMAIPTLGAAKAIAIELGLVVPRPRRDDDMRPSRLRRLLKRLRR